MERTTKQEKLNPVARLHIMYGTIIMFMSLAFIITLLTMKSSYKNGFDSSSVGQNQISAQMPEGHPDVNSAPTQTGGMPSGGGMPPFLKKMLDTYKGALKKNPNDIQALSGLGNMYYDSGQYPKAIEYYEKILKIDSKNSNVRADLGTCYFYIEKTDDALKNLKLAIEQDPKNLNARYNLGIVYKTKGNIAEAKKEWEAMKPFLKTDEEKQKLQSVLDNLNKSSS